MATLDPIDVCYLAWRTDKILIGLFPDSRRNVGSDIFQVFIGATLANLNHKGPKMKILVVFKVTVLNVVLEYALIK